MMDHRTLLFAALRSRRYLLAVAAVMVAAGVRWVLYLLAGERFAFIPFYPAALVAAVYGGFGPGILAVALSLTAAALLMPPIGSLTGKNDIDVIGLLLFAIV